MSDDRLIVRAGSIKRGQAREVFVTPQGVVINDENGATVHRPDGSVATQREDGTIEFMNLRIERIEVHDLRALVSHQVQRVMETTSHHLTFADGGRFSCLCDATGKVIEIASRVSFQYDEKDGVMRVGIPYQDHEEEARAKPKSLRKRVARSLWQRLWVWQMRHELRKAGIDAHE